MKRSGELFGSGGPAMALSVLDMYAGALQWIFAHFSGGLSMPLTLGGWRAMCEATGLAWYLSHEKLAEIFDAVTRQGDNNGRHHRPAMSFAQFAAALELTARAVAEKQWTVRSTMHSSVFPEHAFPPLPREADPNPSIPNRSSMPQRSAAGSSTSTKTRRSRGLRPRRVSPSLRCSQRWVLMTPTFYTTGWAPRRMPPPQGMRSAVRSAPSISALLGNRSQRPDALRQYGLRRRQSCHRRGRPQLCPSSPPSRPAEPRLGAGGCQAHRPVAGHRAGAAPFQRSMARTSIPPLLRLRADQPRQRMSSSLSTLPQHNPPLAKVPLPPPGSPRRARPRGNT
jgi:hypothetical protein